MFHKSVSAVTKTRSMAKSWRILRVECAGRQPQDKLVEMVKEHVEIMFHKTADDSRFHRVADGLQVTQVIGNSRPHT